MRERLGISFLVAIVLLMSAAVVAGRVPGIDDLVGLNRPTGVAMSPDGLSIAYVVQSANWKDDRYETAVWLARESSGPFRLTAEGGRSFSPSWSPDGDSLAFLSDRMGVPQLYRINVRGGEPEKLTDVEGGIADFSWSPTGDWIALAIEDAEAHPVREAVEAFGDHQWVGENFRRTHLWRIRLGDREPERLTEGADITVDRFSVSPDGRRIAFSARPAPAVHAWWDSDIYVLDLESRKVVKVVDSPGADSNPMWSPDGAEIAFESANGHVGVHKNQPIAVVSAAGGKPRVLTGSFDENPSLLAFRREGIYFSAWQRTESHLFRIQPDGSGLTRITASPGVWTGFDLAGNADRVAFLGESFERFAEVYASPLSPFGPVRLTDFDSQLDRFTLSRREVIRWKSEDGVEIEGVLAKPTDFAPGKRLPLLFVIHGGPQSVDTQQKLSRRDSTYYPIERFVARGALVLMVNYRGSAGYGEEFRSLNLRNLGVGDELDFRSAIAHLDRLAYIDPERVGTMGWSQGGYLSAFLATHSGRFKAASVGAGVSDWRMQYTQTDLYLGEAAYHGHATPWDDPAVYAKTAPITYIQNARTPTLLQHGEKDPVSSPANAYELYRGLKDHGVPVRMVVYQGFGHGIDKPRANRAVMTHNEEWFVRWIWEGKDSLAK